MTKADTTPFTKPMELTQPILPDLNKMRQKLDEIWKSGRLTNSGNQHNLLENRLKDTLKVSNLTLYNNGTTALIAAIRCLGLSGEVITTPFTFPAAVQALSWNHL